jgi:hypothetical protein
MVLPDAGFEVQRRTGRILRLPIVRAACGRRVPEPREVSHMGEERFEEAQTVAKADDVGVYDHTEIASASVLGVKLECTVCQEGPGIFQPRTQAGWREHQEILIVKAISGKDLTLLE